MRIQRLSLATICVSALFVPALFAAAGDDAYDQGEKAFLAKDYPTAISKFQEAVLADPDSIRNSSQLRQATMQMTIAAHPKEGSTADFDKQIAFFQKAAAANPNSSNIFLNYGFAYVDKIPAAGSITQVILANSSLTQFGKSIELKPTWIALYTRGNSYLYWPRVFGKTAMGVADLEKAYAMQKMEPKRSYHLRVYISLGDGYWKSDNLEKARAIWQEGAAAFPDSQALKDRLSRQGDDLGKYIDSVLDPNKRVDTDLKELWMQQ